MGRTGEWLMYNLLVPVLASGDGAVTKIVSSPDIQSIEVKTPSYLRCSSIIQCETQ